LAHPLVDFDILRIHAEDAAFVLSQRALACEAPNYRLVDLYDLEQRLVGHLDALVLANDAGGEVALDIAETNGDCDSVAVLLHVALRLGREDLIDQISELVPLDDGGCHFRRRLAEAVSWCPAEELSKVMPRWISGGHPCFRWIALEVCGVHRVDPRHQFKRALHDPDMSVRQRAVRLAGELGRIDFLEAIQATGGDEADIAAVLLGNTKRADRLSNTATFPKDARLARRFAEIFPLALPDEDAKSAIRVLLSTSETRRWGVVAMGALGWSGALPSLLKLMEEPLYARVAVSAVEQITGIYFAHEDLELDDFPEDPENPQLDIIEFFAETNTPWPDPEKFRAWLDANMTKYSTKERLLLGVPAWTFTGPPEPWVKYQARHRWIAITQAMRLPKAPLPKWASRVSLTGKSFGRDW
jgi:uncharacterized protein (TIGR02270 family)